MYVLDRLAAVEVSWLGLVISQDTGKVNRWNISWDGDRQCSRKDM